MSYVDLSRFEAMSDAELTAEAGKAVCAKPPEHDSEQLPEYIWDPLNDVYDAMGLAVDLHMDILFGIGKAGMQGVEVTVRGESVFLLYKEGVDERVTTCRAVTLLAASLIQGNPA